MKVLVTGATGFLGGALIQRLLARGERDIRCLIRGSSKIATLDDIVKHHPEAHVELFVGALAPHGGLEKALEGVDVIYHLAAGLTGAAADIFLNTVVASKHLLDAIVKTGRPIKVVLVSSFGVYGVADMPRNYVVDETTPLEAHPERRDLYSQAKLRQEKLFWEYRARHGIPLVVLRPGVIYGPHGSAFSARVGIKLLGFFWHLGGSNVLPLSYVDNCAEAIVVAGQSNETEGQVYNVLDDDLLTCSEYLTRYQANVRPVRPIHIPYFAMMTASDLVQRYNRYSKGQLPAIFTPYKTATTWKGNLFDNTKIKSLGWKQIVPTEEGLKRNFVWFRDHPK